MIFITNKQVKKVRVALLNETNPIYRETNYGKRKKFIKREALYTTDIGNRIERKRQIIHSTIGDRLQPTPLHTVVRNLDTEGFESYLRRRIRFR